MQCSQKAIIMIIIILHITRMENFDYDMYI